MNHVAIEEPSGRRRPQLMLLLLPFLWQVGGIPLANDVAWSPFGLPFPMVWQMAGVLVASATIMVVRAFDRAQEKGAGA